MFCSQCGNNIPDGVSFCPNCGAAVKQAQPAQPVQQPVQPEQPVYQAPAQPAQPAQPVYQQPAYQQPAYQAAPVYQNAQPVADMPALILGILGLAFSETGLIGLILSAIGLGKAKQCAAANGGVLTGKAKVGKILGTIGLIFSILSMVSWFIYGIVIVIGALAGALD